MLFTSFCDFHGDCCNRSKKVPKSDGGISMELKIDRLTKQYSNKIAVDVLPPHARDFSRELGGFFLEF